MQDNPHKPKTVTDWVADRLREEIRDGWITQGETLRQEEIAARLDVSRMPVREAIRRLAAEGWIEDRPNRMALVAPLDPGDARELFVIRAELECLAVRLSFPKLEPEDFQAIDTALRALQDASPRDYVVRHQAFHLALYCRAGLRLKQLTARHLAFAERYLRYERSALPIRKDDRQEHQALRDTALARDTAGAESILRAHVAEAGEDIARSIERKKRRTP